MWLDPESEWRSVYATWPCFEKLEYVDRVVRELGRATPKVAPRPYDPGDELVHSVAEHHRRFGYQAREVPAYFDGDLRELFEYDSASSEGSLPAHELISRHRRQIVSDVAYWTGLHEHTVRSLVEHLAERSRALGLFCERKRDHELSLELTTYITTLCMNRLYKGDFIVK